jgi:glycosyltransferase involved in cell wall biosynthesis
MKVCWIVRVPVVERDRRLYSPLAGVRMRTILPVEELQRRGHDAYILQLPDSGLLDGPALAALESCDAAFFGPLLPAPKLSIDDSASAVFALLERLQKRGVKTLADIHDDHFEVPGRIAYFTGLAQKADAVIVNSTAMAKLVASITNRPTRVIGDPYEGQHGEARFDPAAGTDWMGRIFRWRARRLQLAWFGHQSNLQTIFDLADTLAASGIRWPVQISIVSKDGFGAREFCEVFNHYHGGRCRVTFTAWSPEATQRALDDCDLAVVPGDVNLRKTTVKSANRVAEILRAGRLAVAFPIPSYLEFAAHAWIGEDIVGGIEWAMAHPDEARARIRAGQDHVEQKFSPQALGGQWQDALLDVLSRPGKSA